MVAQRRDRCVPSPVRAGELVEGHGFLHRVTGELALVAEPLGGQGVPLLGLVEEVDPREAVVVQGVWRNDRVADAEVVARIGRLPAGHLPPNPAPRIPGEWLRAQHRAAALAVEFPTACAHLLFASGGRAGSTPEVLPAGWLGLRWVDHTVADWHERRNRIAPPVELRVLVGHPGDLFLVEAVEGSSALID